MTLYRTSSLIGKGLDQFRLFIFPINLSSWYKVAQINLCVCIDGIILLRLHLQLFKFEQAPWRVADTIFCNGK